MDDLTHAAADAAGRVSKPPLDKGLRVHGSACYSNLSGRFTYFFV